MFLYTKSPPMLYVIGGLLYLINYFFCIYFLISSAIATTMIIPCTMNWKSGLMPRNCIDDFKSSNTKTPITQPDILPIPPFTDTPPIVQAAIASSSYEAPMFTDEPPDFAPSKKPATAYRTAADV